MVLLDNVQFPRGQCWVNRNRVKGPSGAIWLTVPVKKKGRGLQSIRDVEIYNGRDWRRKHLLTLSHLYGNAPYFDEYFPAFEELYSKEWIRLIDLNVMALNWLKTTVGLTTRFVLGSALGAEGSGTQLLLQICSKSGCDQYMVSRAARRYIDQTDLESNGITLLFRDFTPPVYPQLWGRYIPNLSIIDLIFNCGKRSYRMLERSCGQARIF